MLCFWTREHESRSTSSLATKRARSPLKPPMANDEEKSQDFDAPDERPESLGGEGEFRNRSLSLEIADAREGEKAGTASVEKLHSTENSTEKDSIASEKIARSSSGVKDTPGDREHFPEPSAQQHHEHANPSRRDLPPPEETGQEPSRRLSPVSGVFSHQHREGLEGSSAGRAAVLPVAEEQNSGKKGESRIPPKLTRTSGRSARRNFPLKTALSRRLRSRPGYFTRFPGAAEGMKVLVGDWWRILCRQALTLSTLFGLLSVLLMVAAVTSNSWRTHRFTYEDGNGNNTITVHAGLRTVQRIHRLSKYNDTATLYLVDAARRFEELIESPYCLEDSKQADKDYESWRNWVDKEIPEEENTADEASEASEALFRRHVRRLSSTRIVTTSPSTPESDEHTAGLDEGTESSLPDEPSGNEGLPHFGAESDDTADEDLDRENEGHVSTPEAQGFGSFQLLFGRDPAAAGNMTPAASKLRRALLGPVIFELNCRYLPKLKLAGDTLWSLVFPALILSGAALVFAWLSSDWMRSLFRRTAYPTCVLQFISAALWLFVVTLTVAGLSCWGAISDVAACVSSTGGASVCVLGMSSNLAVAALALQVLASLCCALYIAGGTIGPKSRMLRDVRIISNASPPPDHYEQAASTRSDQDHRGQGYFKRHCEGLKDVAIAVQENERLPSGKQTPPTVAGQEHGSGHLTSTESQSEAGACDARRDACNSRLRSRELVDVEASVADQR